MSSTESAGVWSLEFGVWFQGLIKSQVEPTCEHNLSTKLNLIQLAQASYLGFIYFNFNNPSVNKLVLLTLLNAFKVLHTLFMTSALYIH